MSAHKGVTPLHAKVGSANLDWPNLGFEFRPTKSHIKFVFKDGKWSEVSSVESFDVIVT